MKELLYGKAQVKGLPPSRSATTTNGEAAALATSNPNQVPDVAEAQEATTAAPLHQEREQGSIGE